MSQPDALADLGPAGSGGPVALGARRRVADVLELAKLRVNTLVVATSAAGYYMGAPGTVDIVQLANASIGTALVAGGAAALNQVLERDVDALMARTRLRPLPDGRIGVREATLIGAALAAAGLLLLWFGSGPLAALVASVTLVLYAAVYTPLKRVTSLSTIIGAVPGALPPLIGWAAARQSVAEPTAWALFLIMFLWQLPHVLAVTWMYREDYARARFPLLPVLDVTGGMTSRQTMLWSATLLVFSLLPYVTGLSGPAYAVGALVLGIGQTILAARFALRRSVPAARHLFYWTLTYLPLLWLLMVATKR